MNIKRKITDEEYKALGPYFKKMEDEREKCTECGKKAKPIYKSTRFHADWDYHMCDECLETLCDDCVMEDRKTGTEICPGCYQDEAIRKINEETTI